MAVKRGYNDCISTINPVRDFLDVMSGKWKLPIIVSIGVGNDRFVDIQESIPGITPKVLAKELKELELHQLIKRTVVGIRCTACGGNLVAKERSALYHFIKIVSFGALKLQKYECENCKRKYLLI